MAKKKVYVGRSVDSFNSSKAFAPISRVTFNVNEDTVVTAGDDTGFELVADCPWATQEMANAVLSEVGGYVYQPYEATNAVVPLDVELGLGVTANGVYSVIASLTENCSARFAADISAPDSGELEQEYPGVAYESAKDRNVQRKLKSITTELRVGMDEITASVQDVENDLGQTLRIAADGVTITNAAGSTFEIDGGQIKAESVEGDVFKANTLIESPIVAGGEFWNRNQSSGGVGNGYIKMNPSLWNYGVDLFLTTQAHGDNPPICDISALGTDPAQGNVPEVEFKVNGSTVFSATPYVINFWRGRVLLRTEVSLGNDVYGSASDRDSISSPSEGQLFFVV